MAVNDFDVKKSAWYSRVLVVTELVVSGTQCTTSFRFADTWTLRTHSKHAVYFEFHQIFSGSLLICVKVHS